MACQLFVSHGLLHQFISLFVTKTAQSDNVLYTHTKLSPQKLCSTYGLRLMCEVEILPMQSRHVNIIVSQIIHQLTIHLKVLSLIERHQKQSGFIRKGKWDLVSNKSELW